MPVDFDFDEEDVADVVEEVTSQQPQGAPMGYSVVVDEFEEQMSEVEARLEVAQYYRLILNDNLFEDAPNPAVAERVEEEIRTFIRGRMQALMGVAAEEKQTKVFSDAEVQALRTLAQPDVIEALKALAAKVLKKPTILEAKPLPKTEAKKAPPKEPVLRKVRRKPEPRAAQPQYEPAPQPTQARPGRRQQKQIRTIVTDDGREVKQDITPQAKPVGPIQPIPVPRSREAIEARAAQSAAYQARVALSQLEKNLQGRYDR